MRTHRNRNAGFLDFLKRKSLAPVKGGLLASVLQPDNPRGPMRKFLDAVRNSHPIITSARVFDWSSLQQGDSLKVEIVASQQIPEGIEDPDLAGVNLAPYFQQQLNTLLREVGASLGARAEGTVTLSDVISPGVESYELYISLPPGTARSAPYEGTSYAPSPFRVASRYIRAGETPQKGESMTKTVKAKNLKPGMIVLKTVGNVHLRRTVRNVTQLALDPTAVRVTYTDNTIQLCDHDHPVTTV